MLFVLRQVFQPASRVLLESATVLFRADPSNRKGRWCPGSPRAIPPAKTTIASPLTHEHHLAPATHPINVLLSTRSLGQQSCRPRSLAHDEPQGTKGSNSKLREEKSRLQLLQGGIVT